MDYLVTDITAFSGNKILITIEKTWRTTEGMLWWKKTVFHIAEHQYLCDKPSGKNAPIRWFIYPAGDEVDRDSPLSEAYREHFVRKDIDKVIAQ